MGASVFEIKSNYFMLQSMLEDGDIDEETYRDTLESIDGSIEEKADNINYVLKNLSIQAEALKAEEKRLKERRVSIENNHERLKNSLKDLMIFTENEKIKTLRNTFSIRNNAPSLNIIDESLVTEEFLEEQPKKINNAKIKDMLVSGQTLPFATLKYSKSLMIK